MCQVEVVGRPKMEIACNTVVAEGMEIKTQHTSKAVADTQAATLEFILINHPLDCTVCDQAGHCKLQDYHYEYNARPSRFIDEKVNKVKAEPLGPHVILDGERCIMCTRCIRFCDEVTETSELGMLNRGDRSVIAINKGRQLDNALSGTVVDLCPVGALTHRDWRFNTRIWFTKQTDSICPGCSTGCNVKVAMRDNDIVQVKARLNSAVNKEWLCDEGRYGFERFLPEARVVSPKVSGKEASWDEALTSAARIKDGRTLVLLSPDLLLEEYALVKAFVEKNLKDSMVAVAYRERSLTKVQAVLISPDYAANFKGAEFSGAVSGEPAGTYHIALSKLRGGEFKNILLIGDRALLAEDRDAATMAAFGKLAASVAIMTDAASAMAASAQVVLPGRSILEKSGLMVNRAMRLQYTDRVVEFPDGSESDGRTLNRLAEKLGAKLVSAANDRELSLWYLNSEKRLSGLRIAQIKEGGVDLAGYVPAKAASSGDAAEMRSGV
jgi:NADH-quinone oxidoreductase subunit G